MRNASNCTNLPVIEPAEVIPNLGTFSELSQAIAPRRGDASRMFRSILFVTIATAAAGLHAGVLPVNFERVDLTKAPVTTIDLRLIAAGQGPKAGKFFIPSPSGTREQKILEYDKASKTWASYPAPANASIYSIATGPDGSVAYAYALFSDGKEGLGYIAPDGRGVSQTFALNSSQLMEAPVAIAFDGVSRIWGGEQKNLSRYDRRTDGTWELTRVPLPAGRSGMSDLAVDQSGRVWFVEALSHTFGSYKDAFTFMPLEWSPAPVPLSVAVRNGNVFLADPRGTVIQRNPDGLLTFCPVPGAQQDEPTFVDTDANGNAWFLQTPSKKIGRMTVDSCTLDDVTLPSDLPTGYPGGLAVGPTSLAVVGGDFFAKTQYMLVADIVFGCAVTITVPTLPAFEIGQTVTGTLTVQGGQAPHKFTASGLPPGVTLSESGVLGGKPLTEGTFNVNVNVTDSATPPCRGSKSFVMTVTKPAGPDLTVKKSHLKPVAGDLTYVLVVKNIGNQKTVGDVILKDPAPRGFTPLPTQAGIWVNDQTNLTPIGSMEPGESREVTLKGKWDGTSRLENQAEVHTIGDVDDTNDKSNVDVCCSLLTIFASRGGELPNASVAVKIGVKNAGSAPLNGPITLETGSFGLRLATSDAACSKIAFGFSCKWNGPLAPGESKTVNVECDNATHAPSGYSVSGGISASATAPETDAVKAHVLVTPDLSTDAILPENASKKVPGSRK
jgi:streptogramin lyase